MGATTTIPLDRNKYLTFTDDFSRKNWVYVIKSKDVMLSIFKQWKELVEKNTSKRIKRFIINNEMVFCSVEFIEYCKNNDIERYRHVKLIPQKNGIAERLNKTLLKIVRCLLSNAKLPKHFWGEIVETAFQLIKKSPASAIDFKILDEV